MSIIEYLIGGFTAVLFLAVIIMIIGYQTEIDKQGGDDDF